MNNFYVNERQPENILFCRVNISTNLLVIITNASFITKQLLTQHIMQHLYNWE